MEITGYHKFIHNVRDFFKLYKYIEIEEAHHCMTMTHDDKSLLYKKDG